MLDTVCSSNGCYTYTDKSWQSSMAGGYGAGISIVGSDILWQGAGLCGGYYQSMVGDAILGLFPAVNFSARCTRIGPTIRPE